MGLTPRENALRAYRHQAPEYIPCNLTDFDMVIPAGDLDRYYGQERGTDGFGVEWVFDHVTGAPVPVPGNYTLEDILDWKEVVKFPDLEAIDWVKMAEADAQPRPDPLAAFTEGVDRGERLHMCLITNGLFERMHDLMGFEEAMVSLLTEPEACEEFLTALTDYRITHIRKIAAHYNVDVINMQDDYGGGDRMLMSPELWREMIKPHLKRIIDAVHELGLIYQHHSCGYIEPILGDLVELGVDAIDPVQPCNDLDTLKARYGDKITLCGGFNTGGLLDLPETTQEQIREEYRHVVNSLAPGGSYVVFPIGATFQFIPTLLQEHFNYGSRFYQRNDETD